MNGKTGCGVAELTGKDFRACVELTSKDGAVVAGVGETCERVDPRSLGWLLAQGHVVPIEAAARRAPERDAKQEIA